MKNSNILIIDPEQEVLNAIQRLIESLSPLSEKGIPLLNVTSKHNNIPDLENGFRFAKINNVVIVDLQNLTELFKVIENNKDLPKTTNFIVFSRERNPYLILKCISLGIKGILLKTTNSIDLIEAINVVSQGGMYICKNCTEVLDTLRSDYGNLTLRELEFLYFKMKDMSISEISNAMNIKVDTINKTQNKIKDKFGVKSMKNLYLQINNLGWFQSIPDYKMPLLKDYGIL